MIDTTLRVKALPAELIITDFVANEFDCNCEKYMLEFLNKSDFFLEKSDGQLYTSPPSECNGECDFISDIYSLDLKLIGSETLMRAKSCLSRRKVLLAPGVWATNSPKGHKCEIVSCIYTALRGRNIAQLSQIRNANKGLSREEKDILQFLCKLETKKNLLLFFPYSFKFDNDYEIEQGIKRIQEAINADFCSVIEYRNIIHPTLDTFFAFVYHDCIVFMQALKNMLEYVDHVKLSESPIYVKLEGYSN